jgi:hypothetical protein
VQWFGQGLEGPATQQSDTCTAVARAFLSINEDEAGKVMAAMAILPLFIGLFLGVPIVAREIESGTAPTVWALVGDRRRWLVGRLIPILAVLVVSLGFLAVASEVLWAGRAPWEPLPNMSDIGLHGPGILAKGLAVFGLALLAGAIIGRTLPAVLVGVVLCFLLYTVGGIAQDAWTRAEAQKHITTSTESPEVLFPGGTFFGQAWVGPDGQLIFDSQVAAALAPPGVDPYEWLSYGPANGGLETVQTGVPGSAYPTWMVIETVGFGLIGIAAIALVFPVIGRRRSM